MALLASGCSRSLTKPGKHVEIVSAAPASGYSDVGEVVAAEPYDFKGDEDDCKNLLRDYAGRDGADIVVIKKSTREACVNDNHKSCVLMRAEAYRRI
ncbi:MAG: hypothetical protein ACXVA8_12915 [Bdellovibrionota bacterium]